MATTLGQEGRAILALIFVMNGIAMHKLVTRRWLATPEYSE
jgi:hypothetical protein